MATLNTAEQLRLFINDQPRYQQEVYLGDGTASQMRVSGNPIVSGSTSLGGFTPSAFFTGAGGSSWSSYPSATWNYELGLVSLSATPSAASAFMVRYTYATFSDQEIDFFTANYANMLAMRLAAIDNLMANSYKRARWAASEGSYFDDSQTMNNLMKMRSAVRAEITTEIGPQAQFQSWSQNQADYDTGLVGG